MKLDLNRAEADLNGIRGTIHKDGDGSMLIAWTDLDVLGTPTLVVKSEGQRVWADLRFQGRTATFSCRPSSGDSAPQKR